MGDDRINRAIQATFGEYVSHQKIEALKAAFEREGLAIVEREELDAINARDLLHGSGLL